MNWGNYLFGFGGRINRAKMWLLYPVIWGFQFVFCLVLFAVLFASGLDDLPDDVSWTDPRILPLIAVGVLYGLPQYYVLLAVTAKRLHDRDKSAWWLLVFYGLPMVLILMGVFALPFYAGPAIVMPLAMISIVVTIWGFVETHVLAGTPGGNRFGADPLAGRF